MSFGSRLFKVAALLLRIYTCNSTCNQKDAPLLKTDQGAAHLTPSDHPEKNNNNVVPIIEWSIAPKMRKVYLL